MGGFVSPRLFAWRRKLNVPATGANGGGHLGAGAVYSRCALTFVATALAAIAAAQLCPEEIVAIIHDMAKGEPR